MRASLSIFSLGLALGVAALAPDHARAGEQVSLRRGCGTMLQFQSSATGSPGKSARVAKAAAVKMSGRVLVTPHFALHYTLGHNVHQPAWKTGDASDIALRAKRDSLIRVTYAAADPGRRDSLMHRHLDSIGAPHPAYIQASAAYFENAYAYIRDTLGMRVPDSNVADYFKGSVSGRFNVDIGDLEELEDYPETYGVTWPPTAPYAATLTLENDFLYNSTVNPQTGLVHGAPIEVKVNGQVLHEYGTEWDLGLAVTIAHEYYHAVQFDYTHRPGGGLHSWYELGAVAMEERLAPQVNDYLGYLPTVLNSSNPVSLATFGGNVNYGNGIFHIFLSHHLGKAFDKPVWDRLKANGNSLSDALVFAVGSQAKWDSLFSLYAASLALAGRPGAAASPLAFSPDFEIWPRPRLDSARASGPTSLPLPALSYRLVAPPVTGLTWASFPGIPRAWRVARTGSNFSASFLADSVAALSGANGTMALSVAYGGFNGSRTLRLTKTATAEISAFPNPARVSGNGHFFAASGGPSAVLTVVSESGRRVATLTPDAAGTSWSWNFRDLQNRAIPPGVYTYGIPGETPQKLLVLP